MFDYSAIVNPPRNLQTLASQMHRNSLRIAPVSAIPPINSTQTHQKNLSDTWSNTNTGHHSKWSLPVSKSLQLEILLDKSCVTEVSVSNNFLNAMLIQRKISILLQEKLDFKTPRTDRTVSKLMINCYKMNGTVLNNESSMLPNENMNGLLLTA